MKTKMIRMKTKENVRKPKDNRRWGEAPRVVLRFSKVFLGFHPNHPGFHHGRLSTLYIYIYVLCYTLRRVPGWSWWPWYWFL